MLGILILILCPIVTTVLLKLQFNTVLAHHKLWKTDMYYLLNLWYNNFYADRERLTKLAILADFFTVKNKVWQLVHQKHIVIIPIINIFPTANAQSILHNSEF